MSAPCRSQCSDPRPAPVPQRWWEPEVQRCSRSGLMWIADGWATGIREGGENGNWRRWQLAGMANCIAAGPLPRNNNNQRALSRGWRVHCQVDRHYPRLTLLRLEEFARLIKTARAAGDCHCVAM